MNDSELHKNHRERMQFRFIRDGRCFDNFREHEILEIMLYDCFKRQNTNGIAHVMINEFGTARNTVNASFEELCDLPMIAANTSLYMRFLGEMAAYVKHETAHTACRLDIANEFEMRSFLTAALKYCGYDELVIVCEKRDTSVILLRSPISEEGIDDIIEKTVLCDFVKTASVVFTKCFYTYNMEFHFRISDRLRKAAAACGADYGDHYIFDGTELSSLSEHGLI